MSAGTGSPRSGMHVKSSSGRRTADRERDAGNVNSRAGTTTMMSAVPVKIYSFDGTELVTQPPKHSACAATSAAAAASAVTASAAECVAESIVSDFVMINAESSNASSSSSHQCQQQRRAHDDGHQVDDLIVVKEIKDQGPENAEDDDDEPLRGIDILLSSHRDDEAIKSRPRTASPTTVQVRLPSAVKVSESDDPHEIAQLRESRRQRIGDIRSLSRSRERKPEADAHADAAHVRPEISSIVCAAAPKQPVPSARTPRSHCPSTSHSKAPPPESAASVGHHDLQPSAGSQLPASLLSEVLAMKSRRVGKALPSTNQRSLHKRKGYRNGRGHGHRDASAMGSFDAARDAVLMQLAMQQDARRFSHGHS